MVGNRVRKVGTVHLMPHLCVERSESYPKCFGKPLNDFKEENDMVRFIF